MKTYQGMISEVLAGGTRRPNRTGVDTISTFNYNYELRWDASMTGSGAWELLNPGAIPLLTTKRVSWKNIVIELLWFISGQTDVGILQRHGCRFWDPWADASGEVPSAYGHFWRSFGGSNDQLAWVLSQLRNNPMSRRLIISAWDPNNAQNSTLPPCHFAMAFNVQLNSDGEQRLCLHLTQRSCDLALGVPYNMASYALLLHVMSHLSGIKPGIFAHTLIDLHAYTSKPDGSMADYDHVPGLEKQAVRPCRPLPRLQIASDIRDLSDVEHLIDASEDEILGAFRLTGYDPHPAIRFKVAV